MANCNSVLGCALLSLCLLRFALRAAIPSNEQRLSLQCLLLCQLWLLRLVSASTAVACACDHAHTRAHTHTYAHVADGGVLFYTSSWSPIIAINIYTFVDLGIFVSKGVNMHDLGVLDPKGANMLHAVVFYVTHGNPKGASAQICAVFRKLIS